MISSVTLIPRLCASSYICFQGILVLKDFDIRKEAGASFLAVQKNYTAQVTENYLEIHLFWAGKGTCCVPAQGTYGPLISAISSTQGNIMWKLQEQFKTFRSDIFTKCFHDVDYKAFLQILHLLSRTNF